MQNTLVSGPLYRNALLFQNISKEDISISKTNDRNVSYIHYNYAYELIDYQTVRRVFKLPRRNTN